MCALPSAIERPLRRLFGRRYYTWFPAQHRNAVGGWWEIIGRLQFDFLVAQGLQPQHHLLDVGCGSLRGGLHFIRYLAPGHYVGLDRDAELLAAGRAELAMAHLDDRMAELICREDFA